MIRYIAAGELHADPSTYLKHAVERGDIIRITSDYGKAVLISEVDYLALHGAKIMDTTNDILERHKDAFQALADYDGSEPSGIGDMTDDELTRAFQLAVEQENERKKQNRMPIARYDVESNRAYLEYPDGRREYGK